MLKIKIITKKRFSMMNKGTQYVIYDEYRLYEGDVVGILRSSCVRLKMTILKSDGKMTIHVTFEVNAKICGR